MTRDIEIHIDELVLHGFPPADRYQVAEALERELVRLLADGGIPALLRQSGSIPSLTGHETEISMASGEVPSGEQIARTVFEGWK